MYTPYLDTAGGGEKYMLTIAEILSEDNQVDIFLDNHLNQIGQDKIIENIKKLHQLDLSKLNFIKVPFGIGSSFFKRNKFLKKYDLIFYLTDGSIFYSSAKKNILHIQSPFNNKKSLKQKFNLKSWDLIIYNSKFTKNNCEKFWPVKFEVIYPPVDIEKIKPLKKEKFIFSVGFFSPSRNKKQKELIEAFKNLSNTNKDWKLKLAGGVSDEDLNFVAELKKLAKDYPVEFYPNMDSQQLYQLYGQASIYWHGAGFHEDQPTKMEHFGISVVEAMAGGAVPLVVNKGGLPEIVEDGKNGFSWEDLNELVEKTQKLIDDPTLLTKVSKQALVRSKDFSKEKFISEILKISHD